MAIFDLARVGNGVDTLTLLGPETCGTRVERSKTRWEEYAASGSEERMFERKALMRDSLILVCSGSSGAEPGLEEWNVRSEIRLLSWSYHCSSDSSTGKTPTRAPHSVVILEMVRRSSTVNAETPSL